MILSQAEAGQLGPRFLLSRSRSLQQGEHVVEVVEEAVIKLDALHPRRILGERWERRCFAAHKCAERLEAIARLNLLDPPQIVGTEELGTGDVENETRSAADDRADAFGLFPLPVGTGDEERPGAIAAGQRAHIGEVVGVEVDELELIEALRLHLRHGQDHGFRPQIDPEHTVRGIGVGGHDGSILGGEKAGLTAHLIEGALVLGPIGVNRLAVHGFEVHYHGEAIEIGLFGDGLGLCRAQSALWSRSAADGNNQRTTE